MSALRREFVKTLFQKRTYIGWAGLFIIPFLMMLAFRFSDGGPHGEGAGATPDVGQLIFTQIRDNGMYLLVASLLAMATFFLPLLSSMAGSFTVAGEAEKGTLRTTLMQPIRRGALLMAKWGAPTSTWPSVCRSSVLPPLSRAARCSGSTRCDSSPAKRSGWDTRSDWPSPHTSSSSSG